MKIQCIVCRDLTKRCLESSTHLNKKQTNTMTMTLTMTMTMTMTMEIQVQRMCLEARSVLCIQHLLPPKESHWWAYTCISIHTPNHTYFMLIKKPCCFNFLVETQCISSMMESTACPQSSSIVFRFYDLTINLSRSGCFSNVRRGSTHV